MSEPITHPTADLERLVLGSVDAEIVRRYAEASLDLNPIHVSHTAAAAAGLDGPVVHGMFIMGQFERLLRCRRPGCKIAALSAQFVRPLLVGDSLEVGGRILSVIANQTCMARLVARNSAGQLVAAGEGTIHLVP
jgi:acyl dehydratase